MVQKKTDDDCVPYHHDIVDPNRFYHLGSSGDNTTRLGDRVPLPLHNEVAKRVVIDIAVNLVVETARMNGPEFL